MAILSGYNYELCKNNSSRITSVCKKRYGFRVHASVLRSTTTLQINTLKVVHGCLREFNNPLVTSTYLTDMYLERIRNNPKWEVATMQRTLQRKVEVHVSITKVYRTKWRAKKIIDGNVALQYKRLYDYASIIQNTNPGSLIKLKPYLQKERLHQFKKMRSVPCLKKSLSSIICMSDLEYKSKDMPMG